MRNDFCVSIDKCGELVEAALKTISGVGINTGSGYYKLNTFEVCGEKFDLSFEVCVVDADDDRRKYALFYTVNHENGENVFCDWEDTEHTGREALKQLIYEIANTDFSEDIKKLLGLDGERENDVLTVKDTDIVDLSVNKAHCDWIIDQAKELKALFNFNSKEMIEANKTRALAGIETMINSLSELKLFVEEIDKAKAFSRIEADHKEPLSEQIHSASTQALDVNPGGKISMTAIRKGDGKFALYSNEDLEGISLVHGGGRVKVDGVIYDLQKPLSMQDAIKLDRIPYEPTRHKVDDYFADWYECR